MKSLSLTICLGLVLLSVFSFSVVSAQQPLDPFPNTGNSGNTGGQPTSGGNNMASCGNIQNFAGVVGCVTSIINLLIPLAIAVAVLFFVWGLVKYISAGGDDTATAEARKFMLFGIIAIFVMVSVWGLVGILVNTFFGGGVLIPQLK
jgi:hypothetical protein